MGEAAREETLYEKTAREYSEQHLQDAAVVNLKDTGAEKSLLSRSRDKLEKRMTGISKSHLYYVCGALVLIVCLALLWGLFRTPPETKEDSAVMHGSTAVKGDHLINVPKDYTAQAEEEARRKAEEERKKKLNQDKTQTDSATNNENIKQPVPPNLPPQPEYRRQYEPNPAEKAKLAAEERQMKALMSPIGIYIKERK